MSTHSSTEQISFRPIDPDHDADGIHAWLTEPRAQFWGMTETTRDEAREHLRAVRDEPAQDGWIGSIDGGTPVVYVETYDPPSLLPADALEVHPEDLGMHLLVGPPVGPEEHGFTGRVMAAVMRFCLRDRGAARVVVEPDVRNDRILAKNAAAGFRVVGEADLVEDGRTKRAAISVCTREDFAASPLGAGGAGEPSRDDPHAHLVPAVADAVHRHLLAKAIAEFSHERILHPEDLGEGWFEIAVPEPADPPEDAASDDATPVRYRFRARLLPLEHWIVEESSLIRLEGVVPARLDVLEFVTDLQGALGIPDRLVSTYLEELASTFASGCAKLSDARAGRRPDVGALLTADLQQTEAAMTEGHPGFLAGSGRIGYALSDYRAFAPEQGRRTRLHWVAVRRSLSHLSLGEGLTEAAHLDLALSAEEQASFVGRLEDRGLDPADYHLMPLHPWQADHRLPLTFASDIARQDLVPLGPGGDEFQPQQSLRTFFDRTRPGAPYVKVALAIQNMGFLRGLSPKYMRDTPAINDWIAGVVGGDPEFDAYGFGLLRERSALGYTGDAYHRTRTTNPHRKMLAALWRENPLPMLAPGERAMTMAAILHRDHEGHSLATAMIRASDRSAEEWAREYLEAYLHPLVHALLAHDVVFMPHGENLILRVREKRIVGAFMKDIGEEMAVVGERSLPADVERIRALIPGDEKALSIFTDVFDGVLRHLSGILDADGMLPADGFWSIVAGVLDAYEQRHPELARGLAGDVDLRAESFAHSCLNRLQLRNTLAMVDIGNQAESLVYAGTMPNPVARFAADPARSPREGSVVIG